VDLRLWVLGERGGVPLAHQVLSPAQCAAAVGEGRRRPPAWLRVAVPSHHAAHSGPRRPRRAMAHAQVPCSTDVSSVSTRHGLGLVCLTDTLVRQTLQHELRAGEEGSPQTNPIVARIDRKSGHGCGRSTQKIVSTPRPSLVRYATLISAANNWFLWIADPRGRGPVRVRGEDDGSLLERLRLRRDPREAGTCVDWMRRRMFVAILIDRRWLVLGCCAGTVFGHGRDARSAHWHDYMTCTYKYNNAFLHRLGSATECYERFSLLTFFCLCCFSICFILFKILLFILSLRTIKI
jgi:hypothetical protein